METTSKKKPRRLMTPCERLERRINNVKRKYGRALRRGKTGVAYRHRTNMEKLCKQLSQLQSA